MKTELERLKVLNALTLCYGKLPAISTSEKDFNAIEEAIKIVKNCSTLSGMLYEDLIQGYSQGDLNQYKNGKFPPRKLSSKKAASKAVIVETAINQSKAELIGTFSLTEDGKWVFMELVSTSNGNLACTCPKNAIEVKQVGVLF